MRPQFANILAQRREQLGLTIPQAASVLRLRESVLEDFESGDFAKLPPLGYAQGMVSSYARYLGLDPAQIVDLYEREHSDYVLAVTGSRPSGLASMSDEPGIHGPASGVRRSNGVSTQNASYTDPVAASRARVGQDPYPQNQPTGRINRSGSGSMRPTNLPQRYNASPGYGVEGSYSATQGEQGNRYAADRRYTSQLRYGDTQQTATFEEGYEQTGRSGSRRYTSRVPEQASERTRRSQADRVRRQRSSSEDYYASDRSYSRRQGSAYSDRPRGASSDHAARYNQDIETRSVSSQYRDDLYYESEADAYRASSTREGREGARNMQMPGRIENARRRSNMRDESRSRSRRQEPRKSGIAGVYQWLSDDPQRAILSIGVLLALILLLILVFSVRSCIDANTNTGKQISVVTTLAATTSSETAAATTDTAALEQQVVDDAAAKKAASAQAAAYTDTIVKVSVANGATTWVEISCDGEQKVAESITGAWEQEYTVTKSIQIQVVDPSSVTVEKNGEIQAFSSKTAGLSSLTIEGTDPAAAAAATAATTQAEDSNVDNIDDSDNSSDSEE